MSLLHAGGTNYIGVRDISAANAWYIEKLGMRKMELDVDSPESIALGFSEEEYAITLGPSASPDQLDELTHILFTSNVRKAREWLLSRGVQVGEIRKDRQGTQYFEMRDLEDNVIEITEEP